jgi:hypothetical protein
MDKKVKKVKPKRKKKQVTLLEIMEQNEKLRKSFLRSFKNERREANEALMKSFSVDHHNLNTAMAKRVDTLQKRNDRQFTHIWKSINDAHKVILKTMTDFSFKVECMEESILSVYHNIKRNQFLYAYSPEELIQTFDDIKKKIMDEHKELKKIVNL